MFLPRESSISKPSSFWNVKSILSINKLWFSLHFCFEYRQSSLKNVTAKRNKILQRGFDLFRDFRCDLLDFSLVSKLVKIKLKSSARPLLYGIVGTEWLTWPAMLHKNNFIAIMRRFTSRNKSPGILQSCCSQFKSFVILCYLGLPCTSIIG